MVTVNGVHVLLAILFVVSAIAIPGFIALMGPSIPGFLRTPLGKLNWTLGMLTYGVGVLVQRHTGEYEMCMGRKNDDEVLEVQIDGEWRTVPNGVEYVSRLGWRPFAIVWEKRPGALQAAREDPESIAVADGGANTVRAGVREHRPTNASEDAWLLNAVSLAPKKSAGGSSLIDRAELQELRNHASGGKFSEWSNVIGAVLGIIMGLIAGFAMI